MANTTGKRWHWDEHCMEVHAAPPVSKILADLRIQRNRADRLAAMVATRDETIANLAGQYTMIGKLDRENTQLIARVKELTESLEAWEEEARRDRVRAEMASD